MPKAMRGWKLARLEQAFMPVFLLGRLVPCPGVRARHYAAVDEAGGLHCFELVGGVLHLCIDELNHSWEAGNDDLDLAPDLYDPAEDDS